MYLKPKVFRKTVTTAGTRERLTQADIKTPVVTIQADPANSNNIYIGDDQVASTNGLELDALDSITMSAHEMGFASAMISLKEIYIDSDTSTEGVSVLYLERVV